MDSGRTIIKREAQEHSCCFTGHRPQKLLRPGAEIKVDLERAIQHAIYGGFVSFLTGMACGVGLWAGEIIIRLREENPALRLICAVPYPDFPARWSADWKERYARIVKEADEVEVVSLRYHPGVFQWRNEWMVNHSGLVIAVYNGRPGGTRNTIVYARRQLVPVTILPG